MVRIKALRIGDVVRGRATGRAYTIVSTDPLVGIQTIRITRREDWELCSGESVRDDDAMRLALRINSENLPCTDSLAFPRPTDGG